MHKAICLLLIFLPLCFAYDERGREERSLYFKNLVQFLGALHPSGGGVARELVLTGLVSEAINSKASPGEERWIRDVEVLNLDEEGHFRAKLLMQSLRRPWEYYLVDGRVDFANGSVALSNVKELHVSAYARERKERNRLDRGERREGVAVNNGSKGIQKLLKLSDNTKCKKSILEECERGSVTMDTWANHTLMFQRWLAMNLSLDLHQMLGTHNSFNNKADGYGTGDFTLGRILELLSGGKWEFVWAQQWFTMTDQLRIGVRHLMLDPVYIWDKMRLCHCGTTFKWFNKVLDFIEKALNTTIQFDSADLGCMPYDRTFASGLQEIYDWVVAPSNQEEFVMVHINDESRSSDWGHVDLIQMQAQEIFGNILFTPEYKRVAFPDRWPTPNELVKLGKRVILTCTERCNNSNIFLDMHMPSWDKDTMKYFTAAPECGGFKIGQWYLVGGESQVVGPIYNGPADEGLIIQENLPYLMQCPVSVPEMDLASPSLISSAIWSWLPGYSYSDVTTSQCPAMDSQEKGRWKVLPCSLALFHACQRHDSVMDIVLSGEKASWGQAECPSGYSFSLPQTGFINWKLYNLTITKYGNTTQVWINLPP